MAFDTEKAKDVVLKEVAKQTKRIQSAVESKIGESDESSRDKPVDHAESPEMASNSTQSAVKPSGRSVDPSIKWMVVFLAVCFLILGIMSVLDDDEKEAVKPVATVTQAPQTTVPASESQPADSNPADAATSQDATQEADNTVLTRENSTELEAVLNSENPGDPEVRAFIQKYAGRTIEFNGYTWDWMNHSSYSSITGKDTTYETLFDTNIYVGDVENADVSSGGPTFRVEGFSMPNFSPAVNRLNVRVRARVDGYDEDHEFFLITLLSLEDR